MITHFAVIRRSGRAIPVTVCGRMIVYEHPLTPHDGALRTMALPFGHVRLFRREDRRLRLMPRTWRPARECALTAEGALEHALITRPGDVGDDPLDTWKHNEEIRCTRSNTSVAQNRA